MTADPALGGYMPGAGATVRYQSPSLANNWRGHADLPGLGGAFQPANLALYGYGHHNPAILLDPNGLETLDCTKSSSCMSMTKNIIDMRPTDVIIAKGYTLTIEKNNDVTVVIGNGFTGAEGANTGPNVIPPMPPGFNTGNKSTVDLNMPVTAQYYAAHNPVTTAYWFYDVVKNKGPWDYKQYWASPVRP
jgi:hypothetical protein